MSDEQDGPMTAAEWDELPPVLTAAQVARVLGPPWTRLGVNAAAVDGRLPGRKIGREWRFSRDRIAGVTGEHGPARPGGPADGEGDSSTS